MIFHPKNLSDGIFRIPCSLRHSPFRPVLSLLSRLSRSSIFHPPRPPMVFLRCDARNRVTASIACNFESTPISLTNTSSIMPSLLLLFLSDPLLSSIFLVLQVVKLHLVNLYCSTCPAMRRVVLPNMWPGPSFDPKAGVAVYKPKSYEVLVTDVANSLVFALHDGKLGLEIDFLQVVHFLVL